MPKTLVKRGEGYLSCIQLPDLEETYRREYPGKSRDRLQAAMLRKRGRMLKEIVRTLGRGISTVHRWLYRMECEDLECRHDTKSTGRPRLLGPEQERTIEGGIDGTPRECGFERGSWNAKILARHILEQFGVQYSRISRAMLAIRLIYRMYLRPSARRSLLYPDQSVLVVPPPARIVLAFGAVGVGLPWLSMSFVH